MHEIEDTRDESGAELLAALLAEARAAVAANAYALSTDVR